jgi:hypothetical protein
MIEQRAIERRPDASGRNTSTYPAEWGKPPSGRAERRQWILDKIAEGRELERRGQRPYWLAPLERRSR